MSRSAALAAIAQAVEVGGDVDVAYDALLRLDPLLRRGARRLIRDGYVDSLLSTRIKKGDEANRHVMRIAYLRVAGAPPDPAVVDDPDVIAAVFAATRAGRAAGVSRLWWATALLLLGLAAAGGAGGLALYRLIYPPRFDASARAAPPPRGAFASGGKGLAANPAVERALAEDLPEFLIALDQWSRARERGAVASALAQAEGAMLDARAKALAPAVRAGLGEGASKRLEALLDEARAASIPKGAPRDPRATEPLMEATGAFDDELAAAGLGYFIDGDVITDLRTGHRLVIVYAFTVESVSLFRSGDAQVRALDLRRLDHLNWTQSLLGFTRPHLREALVLLDQVDEQLVSYILPGLGADAGIALFDEDDAGAPPSARAEVEKRAGELTRAEYGATPGLSATTAERLGALLSRRRALFEGWQKKVDARGMILKPPSKLRLELDYGAALAGVAPQGELSELLTLDEGLGDAAVLTAYARLRDVLVDSVERHEVQHRLDYARPDPLPMPPALEEMLGPAESGGVEQRFPSQARAELSAYLAELSRDERTTRVNLTMIARFLFKKRMQGMAECYAAVVIVEGLLEELGLPKRGPLVRAGNIDRAVAADAYLALTAAPPANLRAAAARLWARLFRGELPALAPAR